MARMTVSELMARLERKTGLSEAQVRSVLTAYRDIIVECLTNTTEIIEVPFKGVGTFCRQYYSPRTRKLKTPYGVKEHIYKGEVHPRMRMAHPLKQALKGLDPAVVNKLYEKRK